MLIDKILLPIGTTCRYTDLECSDEEGYQNFWSPVFHEGCERYPLSVKYRGTAKEIRSPGHPVAYTLSSNNLRILLFIRSQQHACNVTVLQTEHPRLVIREISDENLKNQKYVNKLHSLAYYNVNTHVSRTNQNVKHSYITVSYERCVKKEMELLTSMTIADRHPSAFAYTLRGTPGYTARMRGEAAMIFRCTPVPARLRITGDCYKELPVTVDDKPAYLQPKTREITTKGTQIACDPLTTAMYRIKNAWYSPTPEMEQLTSAPIMVHPGLLPWGRNSAAQTPESSADELESDVHVEQPTAGTTASPGNRTIILIIILCLMLIIIALATIQKSVDRKMHSPATSQSSLSAVISTPSGRLQYTLDSADPPQGASSEHIRRRLEVFHQTHRERLDVQDELSNLRNAYRELEARINSCTMPMQIGLNRFAVAPSQNRSQSNEGGVTNGAST